MTAVASSALDAYESALRTGDDLLVRRSTGGLRTPLGVRKFLDAADPVDLSLLELCQGPVLDVGCGPGRMVAALVQHGYDALGIDIAAEAVRHTRARGAAALRRSVFQTIPDEGTWGTVLLVDGNIGIGGDPALLLRRCRQLVGPNGRIVVELDVDPHTDLQHRMVFVDGADQPIGEPFGWASLGEHAMRALAVECELRVQDVHSLHGRVFALLTTLT